MTSQAVSGVSELKNGPSEVVTSAQPVTPSARSSTRTTVRSRVTPKLVSKGGPRQKGENCVRRSSVVPAETLALLFRDLLCQSEGLRAAIVANGSKDGIDQNSGRGVGGAKGGGFDGGQKNLVAFPGQRRNICVRNAHTIGSAGAGLVRALHRLPEPAAKADCYD